MSRWLLRYPVRSDAPLDALDRLACDPQVEMLDRVGHALALIDVPEHALSHVRTLLPGWIVEPEQEGILPERRRR
jgi:hypothetical protein